MSDELPSGWAEVSLADVVSQPRSKVAPADYPDLPFVGMDHIAPGGMELLGSVPFGSMKSNGGLFLEGDVLYGRMRPYLNKVHRAKSAGACSAEFIVFPRSNAIDGDFLAYTLHHRAFVNFASAQSSGDRPRVDFGDLAKYEFALPPMPEQKRIVSKIDELFSRIDEGERALERVSKLVERYRQSVLKAAVTGELTRDWREARKTAGKPIESGEALLARILTARRQAWEQAELAKMQAKGITPKDDAWKKKYKEPAPPGTIDLSELPEGWVWTSVEQLCFVDTGATPKRGTEKYFKDGTIDWITSAAVNESVIRSSAERITSAAVQETNAKVFPIGSLIVAMYGEGKTRGKVSELGIAAATNQACAALLCGHLDAAVKAYIRTYFEKNYAALRTEAAGGVQPNLNLAIIKETVIPLPPLDEVREINEIVAARMSQVVAFVAEFPSWGKRSSALRQRILSHAFAGALVGQNPADESASALFERIAAERPASNTVATKRGRKLKNPA
ncbi:type I restriction enzyme S subunit [Luteimonas cucumeris]|uniref:Type I restriction enzyme S subunit n=1 Tax=Luteimonas cucumeris TaxID=985012 RepID=A0A562LEN6_9GAMM|nr:restriction endonuclease subunit S [Luteimonas cucumeris]TWI06078.1 type I restriction enzyme S subunit [Luteimonas cucumeris]